MFLGETVIRGTLIGLTELVYLCCRLFTTKRGIMKESQSDRMKPNENQTEY